MSSTLTNLTAATTWSGTDLFYATVSGNSRKIAASNLLVKEAADTLSQVNSTTAQAFRMYRTFTDTSNYERLTFQSGSGYFEIAPEQAGTGTDNISVRVTPLGTGSVSVTGNPGDYTNPFIVTNNTNIDFANCFRCLAPNIATGNRAQFSLGKTDTTGDLVSFSFKYVGANDDTNSVDFIFNGISNIPFTVEKAGRIRCFKDLAIVAGGSDNQRITMGNGSMGIYIGSGAPTISAAQGSIYLNSTGSSTSTRLYVNTTGSTTWANFTSSA